MKPLPSILTHVKITADGQTQEFKYAGNISTTVNKIKPNSPFPSWFWSQVRKDHKGTYSSPAGDVTIEMNEIRLDALK
jgi:hypothetical protein